MSTTTRVAGSLLTGLPFASVVGLAYGEVRTRIEKMGFTITDQPPEAAAKALAEEARFLADVAGKIGLEPQ